MAIAVWGGPLTAGTVEALVDSPARREVCNRILKGDSVVWVLVESGEKSADDAAFKLLEAELKRLEGTLELPDAESIVNDAEFQPDTKVELKLSFSALRVSRKSPAEQIFIGMLDNIETDLAEFRGKPLAVPVFGRGRALYALVGDGIAPDTIEAACRELIGPCSCTVKDLNPGVDLLTSVDWNSEVKGDAAPAQPLPDLPGLSIIEIEAEPLDAPEAPDVASSVTSTGPEETRNVSRDVSSAKPTDSTRANVESVERPTTAVTAKPTGSEGSEGAQNDTVEERGVGAYALLIVFGLGALVAVVGTLVLRSRQRN